MSSITTISAIPPLASVTLSSTVTRNMVGQLEQRLVKIESGNVSTEILKLPLESVDVYTGKGHLENSQTKSNKSWLI